MSDNSENKNSDDGRFVDDYTGVETTDHEWDGIRELDNPLPKWWLYSFYACILWAVAYWVLYPAWPLASSYTQGILGYSQRALVTEQVEQSQAALRVFDDQILAGELSDVPGNPELHSVALAGGESAFGDNCAACHGRGAQGFKGYPNLNDDAWLWGGTLEDIRVTLRHGIRWEADDNTRLNDMPKFLDDGIFTQAEVSDTTQYVLQLSGRDVDAEAALRGQELFEAQCVTCHMEGGVGNQELGSPNLTDAIWLYGGDEESIYASIAHSRRGVMPAWQGRLDEATIAKLALYVHSLGGGE
ncbi:Cytochrome c oxidase subunit CcoP [Candidatus Phaeomarinobacter ectocarpi]|uniref:Cbb3-type cytochrome c oxidase subunit n=1 Tax=Candidatus Phaeomarinibacter ectocarpi TaxID=1458461 RepID=X5M7B6_9HYPH|nr:cytochrome-c oxidase, cbb3-type subunit III [Candidatus Phaeomarinobacter ectocarpi]CDO59018.1 Cytochrome c oxidase subunit CcoP [Candidatus Phaeomarinobacter ectocarpi]